VSWFCKAAIINGNKNGVLTCAHLEQLVLQFCVHKSDCIPSHQTQLTVTYFHFSRIHSFGR